METSFTEYLEQNKIIKCRLSYFQKCSRNLFKKNGIFHVLCIEFRNKYSGNYTPECSIFQNGISSFRYNREI